MYLYKLCAKCSVCTGGKKPFQSEFEFSYSYGECTGLPKNSVNSSWLWN